MSHHFAIVQDSEYVLSFFVWVDIHSLTLCSPHQTDKPSPKSICLDHCNILKELRHCVDSESDVLSYLQSESNVIFPLQPLPACSGQLNTTITIIPTVSSVDDCAPPPVYVLPQLDDSIPIGMCMCFCLSLFKVSQVTPTLQKSNYSLVSSGFVNSVPLLLHACKQLPQAPFI